MHRIKKYWHQIKQQILLRKAPFAILHWRYLLPKQDATVQLHRQAFLNALPQLPRIAWWMIALFSYGRWYLWTGTLLLFKTWRRMKVPLQQQKGISSLKQFFDLIRLVYGFTTPAVYYYRYQLYQYPSNLWFDFIYTHELPSWHLMLSPQKSAQTSHLISNKQAFSQLLVQHGIPSIVGKLYPKGSCISTEQIFQQSSVFLKPNQGSRREGGYALLYKNNKYQLTLEDGTVLADKNEILKQVQSWNQTQDYLIQPLLKNHPDLQKICPSEPLITFRVVSMLLSQPMIIAANLEFPVTQTHNKIFPVAVEPETGQLQLPTMNTLRQKGIPEPLEGIANHIVPYWDEIKSCIEKLHPLFPDLKTIGWDFATSLDGVVVIEGNVNWGVDLHQLNGPNLMPYFIQLHNQKD